MLLLERASHLQTLHDCYADVVKGHGRLVFVGGEMGIGKSALVEQFAEEIAPRSTVLTVSCDGLALPGPLGPLFDIVHLLGSNTEHLLASQAPRAQIFRAVEREIRHANSVVVLAVEDAHWADDASIDLLRFLGRRVDRLSLLLIVTWRDDELAADHPLWRVLGDLANLRSVRRLALPPLSADAVFELSRDGVFDPAELYAYTGGNPFFVTEMLIAGTRVPLSIRDAILGRASGLSEGDRRVLDTAALVGDTIDLDLLQEIAGEPVAGAMSNGLAAGLLRVAGRSVVFRHTAVRSVLIKEVSPIRALDLHRRILVSLRRHPRYAVDHARLAWHAEESGDREAVLVHARAAAREAATFKSHRQAADQYARVIGFVSNTDSGELADLLDHHAHECHLAGRVEEAVVSQRRACRIREGTGASLVLGDSLRRLSLYSWYAGNGKEAYAQARRALDLLEAYPDSRELAMACSHLATMRALANDPREAIASGNRAIDLARNLGDVDIQAHALTTIGAYRLEWNDPGGSELLAQALELARSAGLRDAEARAVENLAWIAVIQREPVAVERYLAEGLPFATQHDLASVELLLRADQATLQVMTGRWAEAEAEAAAVVRHPTAPVAALIIARVALGLARIRLGLTLDRELEEALALAEVLEEVQYVGLVRAAQLEAIWLNVISAQESVVTEAARCADLLQDRNPWIAGELARWLRRCGCVVAPFATLPEVHAAELRGDLAAAHRSWLVRGLPFEAARIQSLISDEGELRAALATFNQLGASTDAARVMRLLRERGARHVPRGPRPGTRATYGSLTPREVQVLELLAEGCTNAEVAGRLFLSPKTAGHHVSSILAKLNVHTRDEAVAAARAGGLVPK